jgi:hypothetical protein
MTPSADSAIGTTGVTISTKKERMKSMPTDMCDTCGVVM